MPIVKYGGGVTDMRGSVAGNVHARNKSGSFMRARTKPRNPNSTRQCNSRALLSQLNTSWMTQLNDTQRNQWNTYAASIATKNKLGESVHLTGFSQFLRSNQARMTAGLSLSANGPTTLNLPEKDPSFSISGETVPVLAISFDTTLPWVSENGGAMLVHSGPPQNVTRNQFNSPWRYAGIIHGNTVTPPTSPQVIPLPFPIAANQKLFVKAAIIRADGRSSNSFRPPPKIYTQMLRLITSNGTPTVSIFLRNLTGGLLQTFSRPSLWRGIHQDPLGNTLWCVIPTNDHIINFTLSGSAAVIICDGHTAEPVKGFDGITIDTRDGTLWTPGDKASVETLNHYSRHVDANSHYTLLATFNITPFVGVAKDICFDSLDNTVWITDTANKKIVHVSPETGLEISGTINLIAMGYPAGVNLTTIEYHYATNTFYCGDPLVGVYHMTKTGVLIETITLASNPSGLNSCTLAPITIVI